MRQASKEYYDTILDFCRTSKSTMEIAAKFNLPESAAQYRASFLCKKGLMEAEFKYKPGTRYKMHKYTTVPSAEFPVQKTKAEMHKDASDAYYARKDDQRIPGAKVITADDYHTKGSSIKHSAWRGYSCEFNT